MAILSLVMARTVQTVRKSVGTPKKAKAVVSTDKPVKRTIAFPTNALLTRQFKGFSSHCSKDARTWLSDMVRRYSAYAINKACLVVLANKQIGGTIGKNEMAGCTHATFIGNMKTKPKAKRAPKAAVSLVAEE